MGAAGIGNKAPRAGRPYRTKWCPLCPAGTPSSEEHIAMVCPAVDQTRRDTGLLTTINLGILAGLEGRQVYFNLLNGLDCKGRKLPLKDFLDVGRSLGLVLDKWMGMW